MQPLRMVLLTVAASASLAPGCASFGEKADETKDLLQMAAQAKVAIEQAIKTASDRQPGRVIEAELEKKHGKAVWEVEVVTADGKIVEVHVDAESGAVIDVEAKKPE